MASGQLRSFFSALAADHEELGRFMSNPEAVLAASDLDDDDKAAVLSGDPDVLRAQLRDPNVYLFLVLIVLLQADLDPRAVLAARVLAEAPSPEVVAEALGKAFGEAFAQAVAKVLGATAPDE